ncbi:hypothetical protein [Fundidesulfovibrio agrisoli]|uniref:hypothetical protein n=1 Tax=Fundidesulfovibrio agrisoli TaxID=2922717 RepID=UPI001FADC879|nr:hypothetical protein [Fundidesulfovibrio agrisoli]
MNRNRKWLVGVACAIVATVLYALPASALYVEPAMIGSNTGKVVRAGFTDLPLRDGQGTTSGVVMKLAHNQPLNVWWNDGEGWAYVEVPGSKQFGWVCLANTY